MSEEASHVDHSQKLTHLSLCTGYGGIDLGLKRALGDVRTVAYVEIEAFACENLVTKVEAGLLDAAPIWTNLKTFPWESFRDRVDILSGGFPCQPFSSAGRRAGDDDPRHLWPHITAGIRSLGHPPIVFFENVEGIISSKLKGDGWADPAGTPVLLHVLRELERLGYEATAGVFSASEIGAPHQRKRVFIMGCRSDLSSEGRGIVDRLLRGTERRSDVGNDACWSVHGPRRRGRSEQRGAQIQARESGAEELAHTCDYSGRCSRASVHSDRKDVDGGGESVPSERDAQDSHAQHASDTWPAPRGAEQHPWEPPRVTAGDLAHRDEGQIKPAMGRDIDGAPRGMGYAELCHAVDSRADELRLLGNGVVPATAERAFKVLWDRL